TSSSASASHPLAPAAAGASFIWWITRRRVHRLVTRCCRKPFAMLESHRPNAGRGANGGPPVDPRIIRVLLRYRESVASATETAYRDLVSLGVSDPGAALPRTLMSQRRPGTRPVDTTA